MNEIEKMYENAGVGFQKHYVISGLDYGEEFTPYIEQMLKSPPFTTEKQIEILKLILKKRRILDVGYIIEEKKYHCMHYERVFDSFEEALCADVNYHWRDLTEEEREEIRKILKG